MTSAHKVIVIKAEERVGGGQELWVEDDLDTVRLAVEELTPAEAAEDRVQVIVNHVVRGDGRQVRRLGSEDAALQLGQVITSQEVVAIRNISTETSLVQPLSDIFLNVVNCILETLGDGVTTQRLHVKTVGLSRENEEGNDSHVTVGILQQVIQSGQRFYEHVRTLVSKLVSIKIEHYSQTVRLKFDGIPPAGCKHVERFIQIEVKVSVEVSPHKLMDLVLTLGVQILELVEVSLHVETVRGQDVRLPLHQVLTLHPSDLAANAKIEIVRSTWRKRASFPVTDLTVVKTCARCALALSMQYRW